jgi:hypothetical protein
MAGACVDAVDERAHWYIERSADSPPNRFLLACYKDSGLSQYRTLRRPTR